MKTLLVVDSSSLIFRAYYATHYSDNHPAAAIHLYINWLSKLIYHYSPDYLVSALDVHNKQSNNFKLNSDYKANRTSIPQELRDIFSTFHEESQKIGFNLAGVEGNEADDVVASIVHNYSDDVDRTIVVSNDKDLLQLVDDEKNIFAISLVNGGGHKIWHNEDVNKKFKITKPTQVAVHKALAGDPSDNYKGVPGIGSNTASDLARRYGTIDNIYKAIESGTYTRRGMKSLMLNKDLAYSNFKLAKLNDKLPIKELSEYKKEDN